jgi:hypothetical protein
MAIGDVEFKKAYDFPTKFVITILESRLLITTDIQLIFRWFPSLSTVFLKNPKLIFKNDDAKDLSSPATIITTTTHSNKYKISRDNNIIIIIIKNIFKTVFTLLSTCVNWIYIYIYLNCSNFKCIKSITFSGYETYTFSKEVPIHILGSFVSENIKFSKLLSKGLRDVSSFQALLQGYHSDTHCYKTPKCNNDVSSFLSEDCKQKAFFSRATNLCKAITYVCIEATKIYGRQSALLDYHSFSDVIKSELKDFEELDVRF